METPHVVVTGHVCLDANETEGTTYKGWGSPAMYMADQLARIGVRPDVLTSYGADFVPYADNVRLVPPQPNQDCTLLYRNVITPDKRLWFSENTQAALPPRLDDEARSTLSTADLHVFAPLLPNYPVVYVQEMVSYLPPETMSAFCAQGYLRTVGEDSRVSPRDFEEAADILPLFDIAILSEEDHPQAAELTESWAQIPNVGTLILTQGSAGATIVTAERVQRVPTVPVDEEDIKDSVGCGDVFGIGTAYEYYLSGDIVAAVRKGHALARKKLITATKW